MLEPDEVLRWERHARALGRKADDAEGLAQVLAIVDRFEASAMDAITRMQGEEGFSWAYLARPLGITKQGLQQRHQRYLARRQCLDAAS